MNGYNGWSKSLTGERRGYFDSLEITEPLTMDTFNVNDITIFDNASGLNLNFSNGFITNLSGNNSSFITSIVTNLCFTGLSPLYYPITNPFINVSTLNSHSPDYYYNI